MTYILPQKSIQIGLLMDGWIFSSSLKDSIFLPGSCCQMTLLSVYRWDFENQETELFEMNQKNPTSSHFSVIDKDRPVKTLTHKNQCYLFKVSLICQFYGSIRQFLLGRNSKGCVTVCAIIPSVALEIKCCVCKESSDPFHGIWL